MKINKKKDECCGCSACESICPHNAITMKPDTLGFLYPSIDNALCTNCGLCEKVCEFNENYNIAQNLKNPIPYAVRHKNIEEIKTSQSGAAFIALSDWILEQGGVVYGAAYGNHFNVIHKKATNKEERNEFKGSKYVQSDLNTIFKQIKDDLKDGLIVLFSGTPCQTAGLNSFIGKKWKKNLYLIDLICHGVPAPFIWNEYIRYIENKEKNKLVKVNFRDKKDLGWRSHIESFHFTNKSISSYTYTYAFYSHIMLRYSCGKCPYTNLKRPSDITIGDFWGIEKTKIAFFAEDNKGCSLVLINTNKGKEWFNEISNTIHYKTTTLEECLQPNLQHPTVLHPKRDDFEKDFTSKGFVYVMKKYGNMGWKYKTRENIAIVKHKIAKYIPKSIKIIIKKTLIK